MAYTAKLLGKTVDTGQNRVTYVVEFTDGQQTFNTPFNLALYTPVDQVKQIIRERIDEYEKADVIQPQLIVGNIDLTGVTLTTPEKTARTAWHQKRARRNLLREMVAEGFLVGAKLTAVQDEIATLGGELNTGFNASLFG